MIQPFSSYKKALKVIDSCANSYHLDGARNYVNNFFRVNSVEKIHVKVGFRTYVTDDFIGEMYNRLLKKLHLKELDLIG
jgi:hypothetical protein